MQINPHLSFNGQCEAAFKFYEQHLGGKITFKMTHAESPMADRVPADWQGKIMHATLTFGDRLIQGMDAAAQHYAKPQGFFLAISTSDSAEAERIFNVLADGGQVAMPLQQTFWARLFGMVTDRFGIPWMINCEQSPSPTN